MSASTGGGSSNNVGGGSVPYGPGLSPQPGFSYRNVWKPLTISFIGRYCIRGRIVLLDINRISIHTYDHVLLKNT